MVQKEADRLAVQALLCTMKASVFVTVRAKGKQFVDVIRDERIKRNLLHAIPFWAGSLITGVVAVAYTRLFGYAEGILQYFLHLNGWSLFIVTPLCFLLAWSIVRFAPTARGSGIPQVMAAIELATPKHKDKIGSLLSLRIILIKISSSLLMVMGGGAVGREGPTIQIAGSIFNLVNKWIPKSWPKLSAQSYILTGAAAGLAAAFNTPLGGVVFAMEELSRIHLRHFRTALFSAVIIAGLTAQAMLGPYLYLGYPDVHDLHYTTFAAVGFTAVITGFMGSWMCKIILRIMRWKRSFNTARSVLYLLAAGLFMAFTAHFIDREILGSGKELMNTLLFTPVKDVSWHTVLTRIAGPVISFNTGAAGGVFAPALAAGASIGAFLSGLFNILGSNANILILSGMVGFLTGVTRTPFTSAILVLEMTDRHSVIFHLMIAGLISNLAALLVDKHSFYEQLKKSYMQEALGEPVVPAAGAV